MSGPANGPDRMGPRLRGDDGVVGREAVSSVNASPYQREGGGGSDGLGRESLSLPFQYPEHGVDERACVGEKVGGGNGVSHHSCVAVGPLASGKGVGQDALRGDRDRAASDEVKREPGVRSRVRLRHLPLVQQSSLRKVEAGVVRPIGRRLGVSVVEREPSRKTRSARSTKARCSTVIRPPRHQPRPA